MSSLVENPYPTFKDANGEPLEDGYIFIGEPGLSPASNPLQAYWDTLFTVPANDIRTKGGYPSNSGTPGRLYTDGNYSILVKDREGATVYTQLDALDYSNALTTGTVSSVDTLEDLRNIVSGEAYVQMSVAGASSPGDGAMGPLYYWDPDSVDADNDSSIIKPFTVTGAGRWLWIGTNLTISSETVTITGTIDPGETNKVLLVDSATATVQTLEDGNFQGQEITIFRKGAGTVEIEGTGIAASSFVSESRKLTWLDVQWEDIDITADTATVEVVSATTINATTGAFSGALTSTTLNTGQGANELYDMNQNVKTTSSPTFASVKIGADSLSLKAQTFSVDLNSSGAGTLSYSSVGIDISNVIGMMMACFTSTGTAIITGPYTSSIRTYCSLDTSALSIINEYATSGTAKVTIFYT